MKHANLKNLSCLAAALTLAIVSLTSVSAQTAKPKMATDIPPEITTPDTVETGIGTLKFFDGFPDDATVQKVYDNLDFMHGVDAFLNAMPGASTEALRVGFASQGADNNQTVLIMEDLMDSKSLFLTANTESVYNLMWLDTKAGPLVIETPPNVLGIIDDHWFQYVTDFGRVGPDKNKGGKFLLLPPGYTDEGARRLLCATFQNLRKPRLLARIPRGWQHPTRGRELQEICKGISFIRGREPAAHEVHQRLRQGV